MNRSRRFGALFVSLLCVAAIAVPAVSASISEPETVADPAADDTHSYSQQAAAPNISVTVGDTLLPAGETITTTNDPTLTLAIAADATIEIISVRVDDETRRSYVPNSSTFSETTTLDLDAGTHQLSVVVRTTEGTTTYDATVIEDSGAPLMTFESPISAGFVGPNGTYEQLNDTYTLNKSSVELRGRIHDQSNVEQVIIEHEYRYQYGNEPRDTDTRIEITEPNQTISRTLRLGPTQPDVGSGVNTLNIELRDEFGHIREYETTLRVEDSDPPNISVLEQYPVATRSAVRIDAEATDRVGLASVGLRIGPANGSGQQYLYTERQPTKQAISKVISPTVDVFDGTRNITLVATDQAGQTTTRQLSVNYTELVTPKIQFNRSLSGSVDERTVQAAGTVSDGQITRVRVETLTPDGETIDINSVYSGGVTENLTFRERLDAESYPAAVRVRVLDVTGTEHTRRLELSQSEPADPLTRPTEQSTDRSTDSPSGTTLGAVESGDPIQPSSSNQSSLLGGLLSFLGQHALAIGGLTAVGIGGAVYQQRRG
ncbi:hypothetical protein [Halobacterium hubeiense]|uniref:hypothetical protein n=1 Tax=Halobacterium hubeiense TaxID=1407499 RepID=UPI000B7C7AB9|nr:hypothetical protein [Halobacterium hubeiense]